MLRVANIRAYLSFISVSLSGLCLVLIFLLVLAQVGARFFGLVIPSSEDFTGWLLSASIFFGLAYTFNRGGHIRMTTLLTKLTPKARRRQEMVNIIVGSLLSGFLAFYAIVTVYESFVYQELTDTYLAVPLWMVQSPMAIGSLFLLIAMLDGFVQMVQGEESDYIKFEDKQSAE